MRAVDEEPVDVGVALDEREVGIDGSGEQLARCTAGAERRLQLGQQRGGELLGDRLTQPSAVVEEAVEDRLGDADLGRDLLHRRAGAVAPDDAHRRLDQFLSAGGAVLEAGGPAGITARPRRRAKDRAGAPVDTVSSFRHVTDGNSYRR